MMRLRFLLVALVFSSVLGLDPAHAQHPLWLIDADTRIRGINFQYLDTRTLEPDELRLQIATPDPPVSFRSRFLRFLGRLPLIPSPTLPKFNPVELQKDVVRMRRYYRDNGFLNPQITYPNSQLDTTSNTIQVIFSVREGPPLVVSDLVIVGPDDRSAVVFDDARKQRDWERLIQQLALRVGDRYTEFRRITTRDEVANWLTNRGHAFADVTLEPTIIAAANAVDLRFTVDPGPVAYIETIEVRGQESIDRSAIVRELPFQEGDRFSAAQLAEGQRELFGLNLFRFALAEVPEQERDETVKVRFRVDEAKLRTLTAETGFSPEAGVLFKAGWLHRNFSGGARNLSLNFETESGYPEALVGDPATVNRLFLVSATLRQPYFFNRKVSFSIGPRVEARKDELLQNGQGSLGLNRFEAGVTASVLYEILPFRTLNADYSISYAVQLTSRINEDNVVESFEAVRDPYVKSVLSLSATLGKMNDYVNPTRGYYIRPSAQLAGNVGAIIPGVEFNKLALETIGVVPVGPRTSVGMRAFAGRLWTFGRSRTALFGDDVSANDRLKYEDRFDQYVYYAGGSNDVRGWDLNQLGPKTPLQIVDNDTTFTLEADGGTTKLGANIELRAPFFGDNPAWRSAVFLEGARLFSAGSSTPFRFGTGLGVRYQTPVGYVRLDLAYKLNPSRFDVIDAEQAFCEVNPELDGCAAVLAEPEGTSLGLRSSQWRRLRVHLSIGQTF
ncbi:MAG: BamA/TamA family outer membrane protein [Bacteroidota bacterium]